MFVVFVGFVVVGVVCVWFLCFGLGFLLGLGGIFLFVWFGLFP